MIPKENESEKINYYGTGNIKFAPKRINAANTDQSMSCI